MGDIQGACGSSSEQKLHCCLGEPLALSNWLLRLLDYRCFCLVSGGGSSMESSQSQLTSCPSGTTTQSLRNGPMRSWEFLLMTSERDCKCYIVNYRFIQRIK